MSKRGNGEGTIRQRSDGKWEARLSLGDGRRKSLYGETRREVQEKLTASLKAHDDGHPVTTDRQYVGQFLQAWLAAIRPTLEAQTWDRYEQYVRIHAAAIAKIPLARLAPQHLQQLYAARLEAGLSAMTVKHLHTMLHTALVQGVRWGVVARNVAEFVDAPRPRRAEMQSLTEEHARAFLKAVRGERFEALYVLAVTTGMRQGELLALRWRDVDISARKLRVCRSLRRNLTFAEPKTAASRRPIQLGEVVTDALGRHHVAQARERMSAGPAWDDRDLVFPNEVGRPVNASNLIRRSFAPLLARAGLPRIRFHDLRHTAATLALARGVHVKVVAEMLGHTKISTTLDLYSHILPTMQRDAAAAFDTLLAGR